MKAFFAVGAAALIAAAPAFAKDQHPDVIYVPTPHEVVDDMLRLANVALTPHVTWYTADTMRRYLEIAVDNCERLRDGRHLANLVNQVRG